MDMTSLQTQTNQKIATLLHMLTQDLRSADNMPNSEGWEYLSRVAINHLDGETSQFEQKLACNYFDARMTFYGLLIGKLRETVEEKKSHLKQVRYMNKAASIQLSL